MGLKSIYTVLDVFDLGPWTALSTKCCRNSIEQL